jgi:hypothetical protein
MANLVFYLCARKYVQLLPIKDLQGLVAAMELLYYFTITFPTISGYTWQKYGKVPAVVNVC